MQIKQRKIWRSIHLYLGLIASLPLVIAGITGAILVYAPEIKSWMHPEYYLVVPDGEPLTVLEVVRKIRTEYPNTRMNHASLSHHSDQPHIIFASELVNGQVIGYRLYVNPYTGGITKYSGEGGLMGWVNYLHRTLLAGDVGRYVVGTASAILIVLVLVGLYLWLPIRRNTFRNAFSRANVFNWHNTLGVILLPILLIIAFTGITLTFSKQLIPFVYWVTASPELPPIPESIVVTTQNPITLEQALKNARQYSPTAQIGAFSEPGKPEDVFRVHMHYPGELHPSGWELLHLDQFSGQLINRINMYEHSLAAAYQHSWWAIHTGELFGSIGRALWFLTSLLLPVLSITGFILWWRKRKRSHTSRVARTRHVISPLLQTNNVLKEKLK